MLGFDPLYVANEGKMVVIAPSSSAQEILDAMRLSRYGQRAVVIGHVRQGNTGRVVLHTRLGTRRIIDMLSGELLPRIC